VANPQSEEGHLRIANEVWDSLVSIRIPGEARQVLDFIIRKTWGWGKKTDKIPLSQFCIATKLKKSTVIKARKKLLTMNLITVTQKGNDPILTYGFIKDYSKWRPLPKKETKIKKQTKLRDFCYICNYKEAIARHHIKLKSSGGSDEEYNIIILCPNCHALAHQGKYDEKYLITQKGNVENLLPKKETIVTQKGNETLPKKLPSKDTTKDTTKDKTFIPEKTLEEIKAEIRGKEIQVIFDYWNSLYGPVKHRSIDGFESSINARLKTYTIGEIKESISNYAKILQSPDHYWTHKFGLKDFLDRKKNNIDRFATRNEPFINFLIDKKKPKQESPTARRYREAMERGDDS
jgi:phage replication O-like protein O